MTEDEYRQKSHALRQLSSRHGLGGGSSEFKFSISPGCLLLLAAFGVVSCAVELAHAQPAHSTRDPAHAIAAVCASEIGLRPDRYRQEARQSHTTPEDRYTNECAAIGWALRTRARNLRRPLLAHIHAFSRRVFDPDRISRRWIAFLTPDAAQPLHWNTRARWSRHAPAWALLLQTARNVLAGTTPNPCDGPAEGWGGVIDRDRIRRMVGIGWRVVSCGWTRNRFLAPPLRRDRGVVPVS